MLAVSTQFLSDEPVGRSSWLPTLLGFGGVGYELCDHTPRDRFSELIDAFRRQGRPVVSLRNYCPVPRGLTPGLTAAKALSLIAPDTEHRARSIAATEETLEWAARAEAPCVIIDVGPCGMPPPADKIETLVRQRKWEGPEGDHARAYFAKQRQPHAARAVDTLLRSLDHVLQRAEQLEIAVAVRNPLAYDHLPLTSEFELLLREFRGSRLRTWYDVGHARARESLGLESALELRHSMGARGRAGERGDGPSALAGYHLTDVRGYRVGLLPGEGEIDFRIPLDGASPEIPMVVLAPRGTAPEKIAEALGFIRSLGLDGPPPQPWEDHLPIIGR